MAHHKQHATTVHASHL